jgi:hypothetical protein
MWFLKRAILFMKQLNRVYPELEAADPTDPRYFRHVLDWLREPADIEDKLFHHWTHTERAWLAGGGAGAAGVAAYLAESGESDGGPYSSDEDEDGCHEYYTSDEDE